MKLWNPYLTRFLALSQEQTQDRDVRHRFVHQYAWAIPNQEALEAIAKYKKIIEIGAGTGYWAMLLDQMGVDVIAYDTQQTHPCMYGKWHTVHKGNSTVLPLYPEHTLFLCWPPYKSTMASNALKAYQGNNLIYIGEERHGCNGNDKFFDALNREWKETKVVRIPQWDHIYDSLRIFTRRGAK